MTNQINKSILRTLYKSILTHRTSKLLKGKAGHSIITPWATYSPWLISPKFMGFYNLVISRTLIDQYHLFELWQIGLQQRNVKGNFLEVGAWRGGSALILGKSMSDTGKTLFVADTFEGVVNSGPNDNFYRDGEHADATAEDVIEFLNLNLETDVKVLVGEFPLVTGHLVLGDLSLVHIDVDVYESGRQIFEWCAPRLSPNGVIIFDDYGFFSTNGINTLVNEILETGEFLVFYNLNGHAILTKRT